MTPSARRTHSRRPKDTLCNDRQRYLHLKASIRRNTLEGSLAHSPFDLLVCCCSPSVFIDAMESQNGEVVRESAIFAALSPRGYSRRDRPLGTSNPRVSTATDTGIGSLPPVNLRDANSILRVPVSSHISSLSTKTPQSLMMSFPMTTNECWLVWKFLCDWVKTQVGIHAVVVVPVCNEVDRLPGDML